MVDAKVIQMLNLDYLGILKRELEETILSYLSKFPCVVLIGARQVGKSTLLKKVLPEAKFFDKASLQQEELQLQRYPASAGMKHLKQNSQNFIHYLKALQNFHQSNQITNLKNCLNCVFMVYILNLSSSAKIKNFIEFGKKIILEPISREILDHSSQIWTQLITESSS